MSKHTRKPPAKRLYRPGFGGVGVVDAALDEQNQQEQKDREQDVALAEATMRAGIPLEKPKPKRGRPLKGERRKTPAEIKRDYRAKEKALLEAVRKSQQAQSDRYDKERTDGRLLGVVLAEIEYLLEADENSERLSQLIDEAEELRGTLTAEAEQREYDWQRERERKHDEKNRDKLPTDGVGKLISDAPQGKGEIIYGVAENPNTGYVPGYDDGRFLKLVTPSGSNPSAFESGEACRKERDIIHADVDNIRAWMKWIKAKPPKRRPKNLPPVKKPSCCVEGCQHAVTFIHPEDIGKFPADESKGWPRFVCDGHRAELSGHA